MPTFKQIKKKVLTKWVVGAIMYIVKCETHKTTLYYGYILPIKKMIVHKGRKGVFYGIQSKLLQQDNKGIDGHRNYDGGKH